MMVNVLPKQLERLANLPAAANMFKHLGDFPTGVRSSNSIKCDTNLSQSRENKISAAGNHAVITCLFLSYEPTTLRNVRDTQRI